MSIIERSVVELGRRIALMPEEIAAWKRHADADAQSLGIHHSQLTALKLLMDGLAERQAGLRNALHDANAPLLDFALKHSELASHMIGSQELWQAIRTILAQRQDPMLAPAADTADLIAADCYLTCMNQAKSWGLIADDQFREPPLSCLDASYSAATATRDHEFGALGLSIKKFRDQKLPFPIILIPRDHAAWMWHLCSIHHEVGHNVDQILNLRAEAQKHLAAKLESLGVPALRVGIWRRWTAEALADAFGVLLGGAGFAQSMSQFLLISAPISPMPRSNGDEHPHPWPRITLLAELLRRCQIPALTQAATAIDQIGAHPERPAWANDYNKDCAAVAEVLMDQPLNALGDRPPRRIVPDLSNDIAQTQRLRTYLSSNLLRPDPRVPYPFPWRLVPVAAQLAVSDLRQPAEDALKDIQNRADEFFKAIRRPQWLASASSRESHIRQLAAELDFRSSSEDSPP